MRALLFHCIEYGIEIDQLANRPKGIQPEKVDSKTQNCENCILAMLTVESKDNLEDVTEKFAKEVEKIAKDVGSKNVVIFPFAHLSNDLAHYKDGIAALKLMEEKLQSDYNVMRAHFGSHKALMLRTFYHPGNVRYREF